MRIALIVAGHRFTGAAAVAEHWCRALQTQGVEAEFFFRREGNLQWRLVDYPWAHPLLLKEKGIRDLRTNLRIFREIFATFDAAVSFLPHDHILSLISGLPRHFPLIRAYRHPRHLHADPYHRYLLRHCTAALTPYSSLESVFSSLSPGIPVTTIPAAVEDRFQPGAPARQLLRALGISGKLPLVGAVGKLAAGRGFELILDAVSHITTPVELLVIGHGEHQCVLKRRALDLGVQVFWAGKREQELPGLLRSMRALFFTAPGSDWGHRLISEAQSCALPLITTPIPGVEDLVSHAQDAWIAKADPLSLARAFEEIQSRPRLREKIRHGSLHTAAERTFPAIGKRLKTFLEGAVRRV